MHRLEDLKQERPFIPSLIDDSEAVDWIKQVFSLLYFFIADRMIRYILLKLLLGFLSLYLSSAFGSSNDKNDSRHPIVFVPGDGGCQAYCKPKTRPGEPFLIWLNLRSFMLSRSFNKYMTGKYDVKTGELHDGELCDVLYPGWGETWSIENLDDSPHFFSRYFGALVQSLRQDSFFVSNISMRAAPYDFRRAPNQNVPVIERLKRLIEHTYEINENKKVVIMSHSMGGLYTLFLLRNQTREWKQKYVKAFVTVSGPYGGSVKAMKIMASDEDVDKHPVILIPGDGGSQAYCQLKDSPTTPFLLWINLRYFLDPGSLAKYFSLKYDPVSHNVSDGDLGNVIFPGWGDTWSIENLDSYKHGVTSYFAPLVDALRQDSFFISNQTVRGTPFDFRKAPNQNEEFMYKLQDLIEETYKASGGRRIIIVGHSLGSKYSLYFFKRQPKSWKKKYIKTFVSVSGPLGGSIKALKIEASGDNFGVFLRHPTSFREVQRSMPSLAFLLPDPRLWSPDEHLIVTPNKNYSAHDYKEFFQDINFTLGYQMLMDTKPSVDGFVGPTDIDEIYCVHGSNISTTGQMIYSPPSIFHSGFPDQSPILVPENGDGTVSIRSLEVCRSWPGAKYIVLPGAEHVNIVGDPRFIEFMRSLLGAKVSSPQK